METPHVRVVAAEPKVCKGQRQPEDTTDANGRIALNAAEPARPAEAWFTLDRDWVIASCGDGVTAHIKQATGQVVWDAFPGSDEKFKEVYDKAWAIGRSSGCVYWNEIFTVLEVFLRGDHLMVAYQFMPVAGLETAVGEILEARRAQNQPAQKPSLRLVRPAEVA